MSVLSTSEVVKETTSGVSSLVVLFEMVAITGASLTGLKLTEKLLVANNAPSETFNVTTGVPNELLASVTGVIFTLQFG